MTFNHFEAGDNGSLAHECEARQVDHHRQHDQRHAPDPVGTPRKRCDHEEVEDALGISHRGTGMMHDRFKKKGDLRGLPFRRALFALRMDWNWWLLGAHASTARKLSWRFLRRVPVG